MPALKALVILAFSGRRSKVTEPWLQRQGPLVVRMVTSLLHIYQTCLAFAGAGCFF